MDITGVVKKRIEWIDVAKALAIILVIFGHASKKTSWVQPDFIVYIIYSFHMALFFVLSGWTFQYRKNLTEIKSACCIKVKRLGGVFALWRS